MTRTDAVTTAPGTAQVIADVADEQRREWAERLLEGRETLWLDGEADPAATLGRALDAGTLPAAIGWLSGLERAESLELVERLLGAAAGRGAAFVVAVPNTRLGAAVSPSGLELGWDQARALAAALDAELVEQHLAEAAVIGEPGDRTLDGELVGAPAESDDACAWLLVAGVGEGAATARLRFSAQPVHRTYLAGLETANAELARANARLARKTLGRHDAGAASVLGHIYAEMDLLRGELAAARETVAQLEDRLALEVEVAAHNDRLFQDARAQLNRPQYRAVAALSTRVRRVPGARLAFRLVKRLLGR